MTIQEIRSKSDEELAALLRTERERLQSLRFDISGGKVKNIHALHEGKRTIARILTVLNERTAT